VVAASVTPVVVLVTASVTPVVVLVTAPVTAPTNDPNALVIGI